jgi:hypothetical protein
VGENLKETAFKFRASGIWGSGIRGLGFCQRFHEGKTRQTSTKNNAIFAGSVHLFLLGSLIHKFGDVLFLTGQQDGRDFPESRLSFRQFFDFPFYLHLLFGTIQDQAHGLAGGHQVIHQLNLVSRDDSPHRLQLQYDGVFNDDISHKLVNDLPLCNGSA